MSRNTGWDAYWHATGMLTRFMDRCRSILARELFGYFVQQAGRNGRRLATLEAGSGSATVSALMARRDWFCVALDIEPVALQAARGVSDDVRLVQGDLFTPCFHAGSFDLVWNNSTLEHFADPLAALQRMAALTRPGGRVFAGVPYTFGPLCVFKLQRRSFGGTWDGTTFSGRALELLFRRAGLEIVGRRLFFCRCFVGVMGKKA